MRSALLLCALAASAALADPIPVRLERTDDGWRLLRGGEPYVIRGAGGSNDLELLAESGGNSIRTWGVGPETRALLDRAHELGLTVTLGIWLQHERHGFDYDDPKRLAQQAETVRRAVLEHRDHPALLAWGLGNEMENDTAGEKPALWAHLQELAAMVKELDPHHPTMTVIAEIGADKAAKIHRLCPDIDIVGINAYGGAPTVGRRYAEQARRAAGEPVRPYVVTEFGTTGQWEVRKEPWGAPVEPTSTAKGAHYRAAAEAVLRDPLALGSYVFLWGHKQEATATWHGMFLPTGEKLEPVDVMTEVWTGEPPENRSPRIERLELVGGNVRAPGSTLEARLSASDPDGDPLEVEWFLKHEQTEYKSGGDDEAVPPRVEGALRSGSLSGAQVRLPRREGGYRLFVIVRDGKGAAATGNLTLYAGDPTPTPTPTPPAGE